MEKYFIDPHVHCRDWEQSYKATIRSVTDIARKQGVVAIFDMPNTSPPIISKELVNKRLKLAEDEGCLESYYLYLGATRDPLQLREAAETVRDYEKVVGIKLYAGKSVGGLAVTSEEDQKMVYEQLASINYDDVLVVHCEKEKLFREHLWNPSSPYTWNQARPPLAEIESVRDQIRFAKESGFKGHLHITHVSTPEAVNVIQEDKDRLRISCGVTPHHLMYSIQDMKLRDGMMGKDGLKFKVNPPIRDEFSKNHLLRYLAEGKIDWIETDHAPHTRQEKMYLDHPSGIQSLRYYSVFLGWLKDMGLSDREIQGLTYDNIKRVFKKINI